MNARTVVAIPLVLASTLALAGCSAGGAQTQPSREPPSSVPRASSTEPSPTPSVYDDATAQPAPEASDSAEDSAVAAAEKVVRTYAQPKLSADAWSQQMTPLLSQSGAVAYKGQDPTTIPATKVTGRGKIVDGATDVALNVLVPTNAGEYNVALSRSGDSAPWLTNEIRPVDGE